MRTRILLLAAVAAVSLGASAAPASAALTHAKCTFTGHMNLNGPMQWVGGGGAFGFDTQTMLCAGIYHGVPFVEPAAMPANGTYVSIVCGTATFGWGFNLVGTPFAANGSFSLQTAGTESGSGPAIGRYTAPDGSTGEVSGTLDLTPNTPTTQITHGGDVNHPVPPPPTSNTCVDNYAVDGTLVFTDMPRAADA